jgi:hypothetical protein
MAATSAGPRTGAASITALSRAGYKATFQNATLNHRVYFHKLGIKQSADRVVYSTPANPKLSHYAQSATTLAGS